MKVAEIWLDKIKNSFPINDDVIESYTEYFIIVARAIPDYVISDFLEMIEPRLIMIDRSDIISQKALLRHNRRTSIIHKESAKIEEFLKFHRNEVKTLEKIPLTKYFTTLRNLIVHNVTPNIYDNLHGNNNEIKDRRFQRHFVYYLLLENGGKLLLNNGSSFLLESSNQDSFFDAYPLSTLKKIERTNLEELLSNKTPIDLMSEHLNNLRKFIEVFESKY